MQQISIKYINILQFAGRGCYSSGGNGRSRSWRGGSGRGGVVDGAVEMSDATFMAPFDCKYRNL